MVRILLVLILSVQISSPIDAGGRDDLRLLTGAHSKNIRLVEMALAAGANIEARDEIGCTSLMWTAFHGASDLAAYLIAQGADFDARDGRDRTGLMWAALAGRGEVVRILLRGGGNVQLVDDTGKDAADYAIEENHQRLADELCRSSE